MARLSVCWVYARVAPTVYLYESHARRAIVGAAPSGAEVRIKLSQANPTLNYMKRQLQRKGTRSAKRHLRKVRRKQARFRRDCDHVLSNL